MILKKLTAALLLLTVAAVSHAALPVTVTVTNAGNTADTTGFGAVAYPYQIGKFEVNQAEYCEFLNGAAKTNHYNLYDSRMDGEYGGITREGSRGSYTYTVKEGWGKKPVGYVTWESCARFCNWLSNGQGPGATETGGYTFKNGEVKAPDHAVFAASKTTNWVIASENEWYKAAYYDTNKAGGAGYWSFAVKGGSAPEANLNSNEPKEGGSFTTAVSPNGTFDQNGNAWEYNEAQADGKVGLRGGSWYINDNESYLHSSTRYDVLSAKWPHYGFRVVALGGAAAAAK